MTTERCLSPFGVTRIRMCSATECRPADAVAVLEKLDFPSSSSNSMMLRHRTRPQRDGASVTTPKPIETTARQPSSWCAWGLLQDAAREPLR